MGSPPRPPLPQRSRRPRLRPGPGPDRGLAPGPGEGGRDALRRGAVSRGGEEGDRAGPGRGPALAELVPPPHPVPAGPCLAGFDPKPGGGASRGCPSGLASSTVPEVCRLLAVALPPGHLGLPGHCGVELDLPVDLASVVRCRGPRPPRPEPVRSRGTRQPLRCRPLTNGLDHHRTSSRSPASAARRPPAGPGRRSPGIGRVDGLFPAPLDGPGPRLLSLVRAAGGRKGGHLVTSDDRPAPPPQPEPQAGRRRPRPFGSRSGSAGSSRGASSPVCRAAWSVGTAKDGVAAARWHCRAGVQTCAPPGRGRGNEPDHREHPGRSGCAEYAPRTRTALAALSSSSGSGVVAITVIVVPQR
jgi:hypothetical protein